MLNTGIIESQHIQDKKKSKQPGNVSVFLVICSDLMWFNDVKLTTITQD
jgi:hypothetical protein